MPSDRASLLALTAATVLLWGLWGFFGKLALDRGMPPLAIFCVEIIASLVCAAAVLGVSAMKPSLFPAATGGWNRFGVLSGIALAAGLLTYYLALYRGQASVVVPLTASYPVITALLAFILLRERLSLGQWIGLALVIVGAILLLSAPAQKG